jgi:hypothetical protein
MVAFFVPASGPLAALHIGIERAAGGAVRHVWRHTFHFPQRRPFRLCRLLPEVAP